MDDQVRVRLPTLALLEDFMGVYSTVTLTREQVLGLIDDLLDDATNDELCDALFALTQDHTLDNYTISEGV